MHTYLISCDISFYRMQQRQVAVLECKIAFLDPVAICESRHYGAMLWKDDLDDLNKCSTRKAKAAKRREFHKDIVRKVGAYISLQMQRWQDRDVIWAPYHFWYV